MAGLLGQGPGVLPLLVLEQPTNVTDRVIPRLGASELAPDQPAHLLKALRPFRYLSHPNIIAHPP